MASNNNRLCHPIALHRRTDTVARSKINSTIYRPVSRWAKAKRDSETGARIKAGK